MIIFISIVTLYSLTEAYAKIITIIDGLSDFMLGMA